MSNVNVVRTAIAGLIQSTHYIDKPAARQANSTLNEKLGINQALDIASSDTMAVRYVGIGNGGHSFIVGTNGRVKWEAVHHTPRHTALYNQLPFVLRAENNDLPADQRLRYRLRRIEEHNGIRYVAYYLRVLDVSTSEPSMEIRRVQDGVTTTTPYVPTIEDLNPIPPVLVAGQAVTTTGEYIATSIKIPFVMSTEDVAEFVDATKILFGEDGYAVISEMCTVAGVDRVVNGDFMGQERQYTDTVRAQITSFISTAFVAEFFTDGIKLTLDVGNVEPLLNLTAS